MEVKKLKEELLFQIGTAGNGYSIKIEPDKPEFSFGFINKSNFISLFLTKKSLEDLQEALNATVKIIEKELRV